MWKTLKHFFRSVASDVFGFDQDLRAAQPIVVGIATALGGHNATESLTVEQLCVAILGDVIAAVEAAEGGHAGAAVALAAPTIADIRRLAAMLHPRPAMVTKQE